MSYLVSNVENLSISICDNKLGNSLEAFNNICETISKFENV